MGIHRSQIGHNIHQVPDFVQNEATFEKIDALLKKIDALFKKIDALFFKNEATLEKQVATLLRQASDKPASQPCRIGHGGSIIVSCSAAEANFVVLWQNNFGVWKILPNFVGRIAKRRQKDAYKKGTDGGFRAAAGRA
jgi:hypothetical protein